MSELFEANRVNAIVEHADRQTFAALGVDQTQFVRLLQRLADPTHLAHPE